MQDWKVVEVVDGKSKLLFSGIEKEARSSFRAAAARGTAGKVKLVNEMGLPDEEFDAASEEGSLTGMPIREYHASLPPELAAASERARNMPPILKSMRRKKPAKQAFWTSARKRAAVLVAVATVVSAATAIAVMLG